MVYNYENMALILKKISQKQKKVGELVGKYAGIYLLGYSLYRYIENHKCLS